MTSKEKSATSENDSDSTIIHTEEITNHAARPVEHSESTVEMSRLKSCVRTLTKVFFPSVTFFKFFLSAIIPPLADNIIPLFFTGNIPDESALALAGQFVFIGVILEVVQEGVVNSLFNFVGKNYHRNRTRSLQAFKLCLIILLLIGSLLTVVLLLFSKQFVNLINTPESISDATASFLHTSAFSFPMLLLNAALTNYLLVTTSSWVVGAQLFSVLFSFLTNFFLFGRQALSLHWGLDKLGYYKVIQSGINLVINSTVCFLVERISPWKFFMEVPIFQDLKSQFGEFYAISWGNFGDSGVRNFFYFVVTLKFVNNLGEDEAGAWNLLNSIVWGILLIPGYTVANYIKVKVGHDSSRRKVTRVLKESMICLLAWVLIVAVSSAFLWPSLALFFSKSNERVRDLSLEMFKHVGWIFVIFACNNAMDSLFFGTGRTEYIFYQSVITNLVVYFIPWVLCLSGALQPTYWWVLGLYIAGMLVDFTLTMAFSIHLWRQLSD